MPRRVGAVSIEVGRPISSVWSRRRAVRRRSRTAIDAQQRCRELRCSFATPDITIQVDFASINSLMGREQSINGDERPERGTIEKAVLVARRPVHILTVGVLAGLLGVCATASAQSRPASSAKSTKPANRAAQSATAKAKAEPAKSSAVSSQPKAATSRTSLARAAAAARARKAAAARKQREVALIAQPRFKRDDVGNLVPDIRAAAAIVYNPTTGAVLWENNSHDLRSIASLTKMMTAVTFIADDPDLSQQVQVLPADVYQASTTHIRSGEVLTYSDLLHLVLIASDNAAARVLARTSEGGASAFVQRMNETAAQLGLTNTHYEEPSGLDPRNVSTAYDVSHLIAFATTDERLGPIMRTASFSVTTNRRTFAIQSTNRMLLGSDVDVRGGKTGFIRNAGYCLATLLQVPQGSQVAVVILGAASSTVRYWETRHLFDWATEQTKSLLSLNAARTPQRQQ